MGRRAGFIIAACVVVLSLGIAWPAEAEWSVTTSGGTAWNAPLPLTIYQKGEAPIRVDRPQWDTRPLYESPYYAIRVDNGRWGVELIHHKLYLDNPPPEVQQFWISHGYNLILVERLAARPPFTVVYGVGPVLAHPETIVREQELSDPPHAGISLTGFYLSGISVHASALYRLPITSWLRLVAEGKVTAAWARVPVADGYADVPNVAVHGLLGLAFSW